MGHLLLFLVTFDHFMTLKGEVDSKEDAVGGEVWYNILGHNNHERLNSFFFGGEKIMDIVLISIAFGIVILCAFLAFYYLRKNNQKQSKMTDHVDRIENGPDKVHNKEDASKEIMLVE